MKVNKIIYGLAVATMALLVFQPVYATATQQPGTQQATQTQVTTMQATQIVTQDVTQMTTEEAVKDFPDVNKDNENYTAIMYLREKGIIGGYPDGTFKPDQVVNRAETLKMIMGISGFKYWDKADGVILACGPDGKDATGTLKENNFTDLEAGAWYMPYLLEAYCNGLVNGYPDNTFKPAQTVNLVESLKILLNFTYLQIDKLDDVKVEANPYADAMMDQWYAKYVQYAKDKGLLDADAHNMIYPAQGMTRGRLAEVIYRVLYIDANGLEKYSRIVLSGE